MNFKSKQKIRCDQNELIVYKMVIIASKSSERIIYQEDQTIGFHSMSLLTRYIMYYKLIAVPHRLIGPLCIVTRHAKDLWMAQKYISL